MHAHLFMAFKQCNKPTEMNLGHDSALKGFTGPGTTWANEINFVMNHAPGAGSIA